MLTRYRVWCPDHGEQEEEPDGREILAFSANDAATTYAEESDSDGDYTFLKASGGEVMVRNVATGELYRMRVTAEAVPSYTAHAVPS